MWLIAKYRPVSLFSLKIGLATSTGAKTLFLPSPFAIRNALLDVSIRTQGLTVAPAVFEALKGLNIAAQPPQRVAITNLFTKVLKPQRSDSARKEAMQRTIAFREYVHMSGTLGIAFEGEEKALALVETLVPQVNYFGKRGSFFQLTAPAFRSTELPQGFVLLDGVHVEGNKISGTMPAAFPLGLIQVLDDWGPELTFEKVNVYSDARIQLGRDRVRKTIILPYRLIRSSRGFSYYERID